MKEENLTPEPGSSQEDLLAAARQIDQHLRAIRSFRQRSQMSAIRAEMAQMALTLVQMQVMEILVEAGTSSHGMSLKELSERMGLAHSTMSGIVDRLERHGIVHRVTDPDDRRYTRIQVAEEVRDFMQHTWPLISLAPLTRALERASDSERAAILEGLSTLNRLLTKTSTPTK